MQTSWENERTLEASIDLLVDGELTTAESSQLLQRLEMEEDGWRRCALAYIEDQQWANTIQHTADATEPMQRKAVSIKPVVSDKQIGKNRSRAVQWWTALAAAAVWAFFAGRWSVPDDTHVPRGVNGEQFVTNSDAASDDREPFVIADGAEVQTVSHSTGSSNFELPLVDVGDSDEVWYEQPRTVPPDIQRAIRRLGGRIEQEYFFAPAEMEDGRRVIVPVERLQIHPVGTRQAF